MLPLSIFLARPFGLLALALPLALLLLARRARRPEGVATGTLALWREVAEDAPPRGGRSRPRISLGLALLVLALVLGALALAGPRAGQRARPSWRIVLDRSPSMYLGGRLGVRRFGVRRFGVRQARALARASDWLGAAGGEREWAAWDGAALVLERGASPPEAWTVAPPVPHDAPPFESLDRAGTIWVTDVARPSLRAGLFASGGELVPGPAAVGERALLVWNGETLVEQAAPLPRRTVVVDRDVPREIAELAQLWGGARGLTSAAATDEGTVLHVSAAAAAGGGQGIRPLARAGRDGWTASGPAGAAALEDRPHPRPRVWLEGERGPLVSWRPGRVDVAWSRLDALEGEPAAFAVSWSRLFDAALAPPRGVVGVAERAAAGPSTERAPKAARTLPRSGEGALDAVLAALAAALVLGALFFRA